MSDPVTNVAIEDVLSSIRRLVSEDSRVRPSDAPVDQDGDTDATTPAPDMPGRLVLTPALRVADAEPGPEADAQTVAEPEAQDAAGDGDHQGEPPDAVSPDDAAQDSDARDAAIAHVGEALAWEDHHEDELPDPAPEVAGEQMTPAHADHGAEADADMDDETDPAQAGTGDFVFSSTRDTAMPGGDSAGYDAPEASLGPDGQDSLFGEDEAILDEEMLREMVAEIVRQELQGALGERITRNVRKLVRREIQRALARHDLE